jgi:DNA-binding HxlR family transcriptional regulator
MSLLSSGILLYKRKALFDNMKKETLETCTRSLLPIRDALNIINGKWKLPIMFSLMLNNLRFKEMEREIKGITPKMLAKELKELETNQLINQDIKKTNC